MKSFELIKPYFIERRPDLIWGIAALLVVDAFQLFIPRIIKWAVDDISAMNITPAGLLTYALYILGAALMIGCFRYLWRVLIFGASRRIEEGIREKMFRHVQLMPATYFETFTAGDIMAHATNDLKNIRMASGMGLVALTDTIVLGFASIFFMGYINVNLTLMALIPMPFIAFFTKIFSKKLFAEYMTVQAGFSDLMELVRERFSGIKIIKAFNRENFESDSFCRGSESYVSKNMSLVKYTGLIFPMMIFLTNISLAIVIFIGGRQVITMTISPGDFVAFISYLGLLTWPMMAIGWVTNMIQRGMASVQRIEKILAHEPEIRNSDNALVPKKIFGEIRVDELSFNYKNKERQIPVLERISFFLNPGETLGIAGPPGSGKTTLVSLLPRIFDAATGGITIDGMGIKEIDLELLRRAISFMPQEPFLFSGTIRDNLIYGDPGAGEERLIKSIEMARLTETIASFPDGLETVIGEKGVYLSGGQKQRLALARTFLKDSPIVILDDPVSQVDMETAMAISETIRSLKGHKTIIIVSHRFSVFKHAEKIIVLKDGIISESGRHDELVESGGYYADAYEMQVTEERIG
ncbi:MULTISPECIES: ABC transporter ATP-binding protein [Desulfobacula]|uniref:Multidrug resistance-like ATP-binding protein MdlA n=2 Tax=Desulfobacula TaxID=28222 RepID=K0NL29_DESTT|nr:MULTISPECIES: ABC transporter ATP-binding protein [Desulfobacula]CCK82291.1 MdlA: multidrug resistance ABC transporter, ATP-binding/permease protein [Desulfobacula toluolica Tol2]SDU55847.1 ATP-binding cassette, subfamily B [Desulfobacula phenolica]